MSESSGDRGRQSTPLTTPAMQSLIDQVRKEVLSQVVKKFAGWIVVGGIAVLGLALIGAGVILKPMVTPLVGGVPDGAVIAFVPDAPRVSDTGCPPGWAVYGEARGRFIVGAGSTQGEWRSLNSDDQRAYPLSNYRPGVPGGEQMHTLTIKEMPSHFHQSILDTGTNVEFGVGPYIKGVTGVINQNGTGANTSSTGEGQPHSIIPPYIPLFFCKKL